MRPLPPILHHGPRFVCTKSAALKQMRFALGQKFEERRLPRFCRMRQRVAELGGGALEGSFVEATGAKRA